MSPRTRTGLGASVVPFVKCSKISGEQAQQARAQAALAGLFGPQGTIFVTVESM